MRGELQLFSNYSCRMWYTISQAGYECPMIITPKDYLEKVNV